MSEFGSDLHRFGIDPASSPDQAQWRNLCRLLRALINNPMLNIGTENSQIVIPQTGTSAVRAAPAAREDKPFCYVFTQDMTTKLRGGIVTGGETNYTVSDITLFPTSTSGWKHWLAVAFEANEADDVLLPGVASITNITNAHGATVPDNDIPTMADPTGLYHIVLGNYTGSRFVPVGCGNILMTHCPGSISYLRLT